jgi:non-ribosomal peptide synthetase component E (peptide arylation enzyme)
VSETDTVTEVLDVVGYPEEFVARYDAAGVPGQNTIAQEFRATADAHPDHLALITPEHEFTYAELDRQTDHIALALRDAGLLPGERVLMQTTNHHGAVLAWYGLLKAGLVPVATLAQHRQHEIFEIARQCEPAAHLIEPAFSGHDLVALARETAERTPSMRVLLTIGTTDPPPGALAIEAMADGGARGDLEARAGVEEIQRGLARDSLACLQLSGGTTSIPKLIPRLQAEYWLNARLYAEGLQLAPGDCLPHLLPVIHNAGIVCGLHAAHAVGACFGTCAPALDDFTKLAQRGHPTHILMAPPLAQMIVASPELHDAVRSLRVIVWVLGKLPSEIVDAFETDRCVVTQMFGQSEGLCMLVPLDASPEIRHSCVGKPLSELDEVRVYAPGTEDEVPTGEQGELCCRGPYTIRGYYRAPQRNAEAFTRDGFYRTGDIVKRVEAPDGPYYALEDRIKDLINRGGEKVNARELEDLLLTHPAIENVALVAMPDPRLGERACAFIVAKEGMHAPSKEDIQRFLDGRGIAKFKWPERIEVRDRLPLTNVQKLDKKILRAEIAALLATER